MTHYWFNCIPKKSNTYLSKGPQKQTVNVSRHHSKSRRHVENSMYHSTRSINAQRGAYYFKDAGHRTVHPSPKGPLHRTLHLTQTSKAQIQNCTFHFQCSKHKNNIPRSKGLRVVQNSAYVSKSPTCKPVHKTLNAQGIQQYIIPQKPKTWKCTYHSKVQRRKT